MQRIASLIAFGFLGVASYGQVIITGGAPQSFQYCYPSDVDTLFGYASAGPESMFLHFCAGQVENFNDHIRVYDGSDDMAPLLFESQGNADVTDLIVISTGPNILIQVISDDSLDCQNQGYVPLLWSVSVDGVAPCALGVEEAGDVRFDLFPNPADQVLSIRPRYTDGDLRIELRDLSGRMVPCEVRSTGVGWELHTGDLANGEYVVTISGSERVASLKAVVLH